MTKELSKYDHALLRKKTIKQTKQKQKIAKIFLLGWVFAEDSMRGKESWYNIINRIISDRHSFIQCCGVLLKIRPVLIDQSRMIKIHT